MWGTKVCLERLYCGLSTGKVYTFQTNPTDEMCPEQDDPEVYYHWNIWPSRTHKNKINLSLKLTRKNRKREVASCHWKIFIPHFWKTRRKKCKSSDSTKNRRSCCVLWNSCLYDLWSALYLPLIGNKPRALPKRHEYRPVGMVDRKESLEGRVSMVWEFKDEKMLSWRKIMRSAFGK